MRFFRSRGKLSCIIEGAKQGHKAILNALSSGFHALAENYSHFIRSRAALMEMATQLAPISESSTRALFSHAESNLCYTRNSAVREELRRAGMQKKVVGEKVAEGALEVGI